MKDYFVIDGHPVLFYKDKKYYHIKLKKYIPIFTIKKISLLEEYIIADYTIEREREEFTRWPQRNWAYKIICPNSKDYWKEWRVTFGYFCVPCKIEEICTYDFLSSSCEFKEKILTIKYTTQDAILIANWLSSLADHFEIAEGSIISFGNKTADITNPIPFFEQIISNNEVKMEARFDWWRPYIEFNNEKIFSDW